MRTPTRLRTATGITGGALGLLGLIATPASACLTSDSVATRSTAVDSPSLFEPAAGMVAPHGRLLSASTTVALAKTAPVDRVELALDRIGARLTADRAQWSGVTSLKRTQVRAAKHDLAAAKFSRAVLATLDRADAGTTAQQVRVDALQPTAASLIRELRGLLAAYFDRPDLKTFRFGDRAGAFHHCDGDHDGTTWTRHRDGFHR